MLKKNGNDKISFDLASFLNMMLTVIIILGSGFTFYLTKAEAIDNRMDKIDINIAEIKKDIQYMKGD